jgi:hypothetical protein
MVGVRPLGAILCLATFLLAGCMVGNSITVAGQGYSTGSQSKTLQCGTTGSIELGVQGAGSLTVKVTDGAGQQVFSQSAGTGQNGSTQSLNGKEGTWTLTVSTGFGYSGQYGIVLTC